MQHLPVPLPKRDTKRSRLLLKATILLDGEQRTVRIRNLSNGGAELECLAALEVGSAMDFKGRTFSAAARVTWQAGSRLGIAFLHQLPDETVNAETGPTLRVSAPPSYQR